MRNNRNPKLLRYKDVLTKSFLEKEYILNKKSVSQMMRELGVYSDTINYYLKLHKIPMRTQIEQAKISSKGKPKYDDLLTREVLFENYDIKKRSIVDIAKDLGVYMRTIARYLKKYNIKIRTTKQQMRISHPPKEFIIAQNIKSFIDGILLGDASIPRRKDGTLPRSLTQGCKHREYLEYVSKRLLERRITCSPIMSRWIEDNRCKNGGYYQSFLQTHRYKTFETFRERWYWKGKKSVPKDFELNKDVLLQCYLSDGNFYREIRLCLDGFDKEDVLLLKKVIDKELVIETRLVKSDSGYELAIKKSDSSKFLEYIGPCPVKCYYYKWKDNESEEAKKRKNLNARISYHRRKNDKKEEICNSIP